MVEIKDEEAVARARRARAFRRRSDAAEAGIHLPSLGELLRLQPFYRNNIIVDASQFAERMIARTRRESVIAELVIDVLRALTMVPDIADYVDATVAMRFCAEEDKRQKALWEEGARRCEYYASVAGDKPSMWKIAAYAIDLANDPDTPDDEAYEYGVAAIGWMLTATGKAGTWPLGWNQRHVRAHDVGNRMIDRFLQERERRVKEFIEQISEGEEAGQKKAPTSRKALADPVDEDEVLVPSPPASEVVVLNQVGNADMSDGRRIQREFNTLLNIALPLVAKPDIAMVRKMLEAEYPYATTIIEAMLGDLQSHDHIKLRPTILVGAPGGGKTSFAKRLLSLLNVPFDVYSCGGVGDASLAGTARRWSTGEPSLPLALMRRYHCASPAIILDEIEKTGTSRHNGNLIDALLGLMEPSSSATWHDPYIQASVDMSHVIWLGTANTMDGIPAPLQDRCRRLVFPVPTEEHLVPLANSVLRTLIAQRGLDPAWALPLDGIEIEALRSAWPGGSMRLLQQLVDTVLKVRDKFDSTN